MNEEIKEILESLKDDNYYIDNAYYRLFKDNAVQLLDYITNLQQENKEWGMIFDTFSSRPYAHRYLEEKRKELGNKRIIGLDSEMIYKEYYDLKEIEQDHKQTNATLMSELAKLEEENERLQARLNGCDELLENDMKTIDDYKSRCEKASDKIQYIIDYGFDYDGFNTVESLKGLIDMLVDYAKQSKDILQNGSENNGDN